MLIRQPHPSQKRIPQRRSFRRRIALLSAALAGTALVGFGVTAWFLIREANLQELDETLNTQLFKAAGMPSPDVSWRTYEDRLLRIFNAKNKDWVALRVIHPGPALTYQSQAWPQGVDLPAPIMFPPSPPPENISDAVVKLPSSQPLSPKLFRYQTATDQWQVGVFHTYLRQVAIAVNHKVLDHILEPIRNIGLIAIPAILLLVALAAWFLAGIALHPLYSPTGLI
jgi:two-component system, OmpR family, heavy metal sensor histidine kinase CusS